MSWLQSLLVRLLSVPRASLHDGWRMSLEWRRVPLPLDSIAECLVLYQPGARTHVIPLTAALPRGGVRSRN